MKQDRHTEKQIRKQLELVSMLECELAEQYDLANTQTGIEIYAELQDARQEVERLKKKLEAVQN